jgi:hypothetical protein
VSRKKIPSRAALVEALRENDGNLAATARVFGCHRKTVWERVDADPELREMVDDLSETFIDEAENQLFKLIREGQPNAIIFFLKTRARHRGYSERLELVPLNKQDIEVELGAPRTNTIEDHKAQTLNGDGAAVALLGQ